MVQWALKNLNKKWHTHTLSTKSSKVGCCLWWLQNDKRFNLSKVSSCRTTYVLYTFSTTTQISQAHSIGKEIEQRRLKKERNKERNNCASDFGWRVECDLVRDQFIAWGHVHSSTHGGASSARFGYGSGGGATRVVMQRRNVCLWIMYRATLAVLEWTDDTAWVIFKLEVKLEKIKNIKGRKGYVVMDSLSTIGKCRMFEWYTHTWCIYLLWSFHAGISTRSNDHILPIISMYGCELWHEHTVCTAKSTIPTHMGNTTIWHERVQGDKVVSSLFSLFICDIVIRESSRLVKVIETVAAKYRVYTYRETRWWRCRWRCSSKVENRWRWGCMT